MRIVKLCLPFCLFLTGCVRPTAVDELAKMVDHAGDLAPGVLSIGYDACVDAARNAALARVAVFNPDFRLDQAALDESCKGRKQTKERLEKTFRVIVSYVDSLDKLASGKPATFDKALTDLAGATPGLTDGQKTAMTGLTSLIADALEKHWRERQAARLIERAEPDIETLTAMFEDQIPPFLSAMLENDRQSLGSLYRDMSVSTTTSPTNAVLVTSLYMEKATLIDRRADGLQAFRKVVGDIRTAHKALFDNRNKLDRIETIQEIFQTALHMKSQIAAMQQAFR